jgi:hypothetical protein
MMSNKFLVRLAKIVTAAHLDARPLDELADAQGVPASSVRLACNQGFGPKTFDRGGRVFCRIQDWNEWFCAPGTNVVTEP